MVIGDEAALVGSVGVPVVPDRRGQGEQSLGDSGEYPVRGASAVAFQAQLALEGVVDGLDPLPDPAQAAVSEGFVASVGAQHAHAEGGDLGFDVASGQALVGQYCVAGGQQAGLDGDGQQVQAHVAFAELGVGQTPGDRHAVRRGEQVELQAPVVAGVGGGRTRSHRSRRCRCA